MGEIFDLDIPAAEKLVLLAMADHARDDGTGCYPAIGTLARKTSLSRRGTQKLIRRLQTAGFIADTGKISRLGTIEYTLTLAKGGEQGSLLFRHQGGERQSTKGANQKTQRGERGSPEPTTKNQKHNPEEKTLPASPAGDSRHRSFVEFAKETFKTKHNCSPSWTTRDYGRLAALLKSDPNLLLEEMKRRWEFFLASPQQFIRDQGDSLGFFCSRFDSFINGPLFAASAGGKNGSTKLSIDEQAQRTRRLCAAAGF
jgi:hypothetical protein